MSVPSWARVGAKVVCVGPKIPDQQFDWRGISARPELRCVYTIRDIDEREEGPAIALEEIINPPVLTCSGIVEEIFWLARAFRPLVSRTQEQDVRAIKSMLRELPAETRLDRLLELLE